MKKENRSEVKTVVQTMLAVSFKMIFLEKREVAEVKEQLKNILATLPQGKQYKVYNRKLSQAIAACDGKYGMSKCRAMLLKILDEVN